MKKLIFGGGIILSFFCIAIIFALSISPTNIVKAQASVTPKANSRSFPSFGAVKTAQSNISSPSRTPLSQPMSFSIPNSSSSLVAGRDYVEGDVIVKYKKNKINLETTAGQTQANSFNSTKKMEKREFLKKGNISFLKIKDGKTTQQKIAELQTDPNIEYAEPNYLRHPDIINTNDTHKDLLWGLDNTGQTVGGTFPDNNPHVGTANADIDAPEAWAISEATSSATVIVAVIDSGVAYNHPDLAANMWDGTNCKDENGNFLGGCNHGYDYASNDKTPLPGYENLWNGASSHGTHVAGIIAATKNNSKGVIGIAPDAKVMALRFGFDTASEIKAIDFAIQNGAKVINASFGGSTYSQSEYDAIARFGATGGIFVAAAGNNAKNLDTSHTWWFNYPAMYNLDSIISVNATDQNDALATFSNYGPTLVDISAPGTNIFSTISEFVISDEGFNNVVIPALPADWVTGGVSNKWATDYTDVTWGNVLWAQHPGLPYDDGANTTIDSPTFNLGGNTTGANISFYASCDTEYSGYSSGGYSGVMTDYMALEYSADGVNFFPATSTFYNGGRLIWNEAFLDALSDGTNSDVGGTYYFDSLAIPPEYYTSNFKFRFHWTSNATDNNYYGCLIDDVKITKLDDGTNEVYGYMSGTSMAAPYVAGLAALIEGYDSSVSSSYVKNIILSKGKYSYSNIANSVSGRIANAGSAIQYIEPQNKITSFGFTSPLVSGVINDTNHTITVSVPYGTNVTALIPVIEISGVSIDPASGVAQNFTNSVTYTVTATNGLMKTYIVTVNVSPASIQNGANAIDVIGQYQDETISPLVPVYTKNGIYNGPNRLGLSAPTGIAMDEVHHRLFISDYNNNRVLVYNLNATNTLIDYIPDYVLGQSNFASRAAATTQNTFNGPTGLAYDPISDRLFVSDTGDPFYYNISNNRVLIFDVSSITNGQNAINVLGQTNFTNNTPGTTQNTFNGPSGLVYDSASSRLFIADAGLEVDSYSGSGYKGNSRIMIFDVATSTISNGQNAVNVLGQVDFNSGSGAVGQTRLNGASSLAYDPTGKRLFVSDLNNNRIMIFDLSTSTTNGKAAVNVLGQTSFTTRAAGGTSSKLSVPSGLAYDIVGNRLFVADNSRRIVVYNVASSTFVNGKAASNVLGQATYTGTDYVPNDPSQSNITGSHQMIYDSINNRLFVPDTKLLGSYGRFSNNRVLIYDVATSTLTNGENAMDVIGQYQDETASQLVIDYTKGKSDYFGTDGSDNGPNKLGLYAPSDVFIDKLNHNLYIAEAGTEAGTDRVVVHNLSNNNALLDYIPDDILATSDFPTSTPGLDAIGHRLFSVDSSNDRVLVYNLNSDNTLIDDVADYVLGQPDFSTVISGTAINKLNNPQVVYYDQYSHRIFVSDSINNRIMVFDATNITNGEDAVNVFGQADFITSDSGSGTTQSTLSNPQGLAYDSANKRLYVADNYNSRIMVFNATPVDQVAPTSTVFSPANNATGTSRTVNLELSLSDPVFPGDGSINIYKSSDDSLFESIPATSTKVTGYGSSTVVINPASNFTEKTEYYVNIDGNALADASGNNYVGISDNSTWAFTIGDFTAPIITTSSPVGELNYGTASTTVSVTTDENANCKYSASPGTSFASMTDFESTGAIVHFFTASNLVDGGNYNYYVKCQDYGNLESLETHIAFSVGTRTIVIPTISNPLPTGAQSVDTTQVTLSVSTDQNTTCKYSTTQGTAFDTMTSFTNTGEQEHSTVVSGLTSGASYNYYIKCQNAFGDETAETTISFSIASPPPSSGGGGGSPVITPPPSTGTGGTDVVATGVGVTVAVGSITTAGVNVLTYVTNLNNFTTPESSNGWGAGSHSFQITNLDLAKKIATITFHSDPITVTLTQGEIQAIDLDGDGKNDINVTFANLNSNRAEITVKSLALATTTPIFGTKPPIVVTPQGRIIKVNAKSRPAVYYVINDLKYLFVNRDTYTTWSNAIGDTGNRFATLQAITQAEFDAISIGGNLIAKAGNLIKFDDSSIVYAVSSDGKLYKLIDLAAQTALYGKTVPYVIQSGFRDDYYNHGNSFSTLTASSVKPE